jgi:hypothetical protein
MLPIAAVPSDDPFAMDRKRFSRPGSTLALLQSAQTSLARPALQREAMLPSGVSCSAFGSYVRDAELFKDHAGAGLL